MALVGMIPTNKGFTPRKKPRYPDISIDFVVDEVGESIVSDGGIIACVYVSMWVGEMQAKLPSVLKMVFATMNVLFA